MKVSDLKKLLEQYPDDMEMVYQDRSNDCISVMFEEDFSVVKGSCQFGAYVICSPQHIEADGVFVKEFLCFIGDN